MVALDQGGGKRRAAIVPLITPRLALIVSGWEAGPRV
jgi:hypothetical protein